MFFDLSLPHSFQFSIKFLKLFELYIDIAMVVRFAKYESLIISATQQRISCKGIHGVIEQIKLKFHRFNIFFCIFFCQHSRRVMNLNARKICLPHHTYMYMAYDL